jgi:hypothetical protein
VELRLNCLLTHRSSHLGRGQHVSHSAAGHQSPGNPLQCLGPACQTTRLELPGQVGAADVGASVWRGQASVLSLQPAVASCFL